MRRVIRAAVAAVFAVAGFAAGCAPPGHKAKGPFYESSDIREPAGPHGRVGSMDGTKPQVDRHLGGVGFGGAGGGDSPGNIQNNSVRPLGNPPAPTQYAQPTGRGPAIGEQNPDPNSDAVVQGQGNLMPGYAGEELKRPEVKVRTYGTPPAAKPRPTQAAPASEPGKKQ